MFTEHKRWVYENETFGTTQNKWEEHAEYRNCTFRSMKGNVYRFCKFIDCKFDRAAIINCEFEYCDFNNCVAHKGAITNSIFCNSDSPLWKGTVYIDGEYGHWRDPDLNLKLCEKDLTTLLDKFERADAERLLDAVVHGRLVGSTYTGECACVVGTLGKPYPEWVDDYIDRANMSSLENLVLPIKFGDNPNNNKVMAWLEDKLLKWIDQKLMSQGELTRG